MGQLLLELLRGVLQATGIFHGRLLAALCLAHARGELGNAALDCVTDRFKLLCVLAAFVSAFGLPVFGVLVAFGRVRAFLVIHLNVLSAAGDIQF